MRRDHDQQIKNTLDLRAQTRQDIQVHFPVSFGDDLYPQASVERMTGPQKLLTGTPDLSRLVLTSSVFSIMLREYFLWFPFAL